MLHTVKNTGLHTNYNNINKDQSNLAKGEIVSLVYIRQVAA